MTSMGPMIPRDVLVIFLFGGRPGPLSPRNDSPPPSPLPGIPFIFKVVGHVSIGNMGLDWNHSKLVPYTEGYNPHTDIPYTDKYVPCTD